MKAIENRVRDIIAKAIEAKRDDDQDGYHNVVDGEFQQILQIQFSPEDANVLAAFAGVVPDGITVLGDCGDCVYGDARGGGDLGWSKPCCGCLRPKMMDFVPLSSVTTRRELRITDRQASLIQNLMDNVWWATGLVPGCEDGKGWRPSWTPHLAACREAMVSLKDRDMVANGMHGDRVTNKGKAALDAYKARKK